VLKKLCTQLTILATIFVLSVAAGCGSGNDNTTVSKDAGQPDQTSTAGVGSKKGDLAPDFTLKRITGGDLTLSDLRGKAVIVDFWDTWCPPCRRALPHLQELSETYGDDLVVVGVAFGREGVEKVRKYVNANGLTFEVVLFDPSSSILADFGGIQSIPTTFLIDAQGVIREKWVGGAEKKTYENAVVATINGKTKAG